MNFKDSVRNERLGHHAEMRALTTASIIGCPEIPTTGLEQCMLEPCRPRIGVRDVWKSPAIDGKDDDKVGIKLSLALISGAIRSVHNDSITSIFKNFPDSQIPTIPVIDRIPSPVTKFRHFATVNENEATIDRTYAIHEDLFCRQLGMDEDKHFAKWLFLIFGIN